MVDMVVDRRKMKDTIVRTLDFMMNKQRRRRKSNHVNHRSNLLRDYYERDLNKLKSEVSQYADETDLWKISGDITNSAGNLDASPHRQSQALYRRGAGETRGYVRDRDLEFSDDAVPRDLLFAGILETQSVVKADRWRIYRRMISKQRIRSRSSAGR